MITRRPAPAALPSRPQTAQESTADGSPEPTGRKRRLVVTIGAIACTALIVVGAVVVVGAQRAQHPTGEEIARSFTMECDYRIANQSLQITRDKGMSWITTDLTQAELEETLDFYHTDRFSLPPESLFISTDDALPIAYFAGGQPMLHVSADGGTTWEVVPFPSAAEFGRAITKRAVGFTSPMNGYAALGTDWSMGAGEHKRAYFSTDGGLTWSPKELPHTMTANTLIDLAMADESNGIVALEGKGDDAPFPLLFATTDGGESWSDIALPYADLPREVAFLTDTERLTVENGRFSLVMNQADGGKTRATFFADNLFGPWTLQGVEEGPIHTVG